MYLLDEPTTGLHWLDIQKLMDLLFKLRDSGNTLIIIEHNLDVIHLADHIVEIGPSGGKDGGNLVFCGSQQSLFSKIQHIGVFKKAPCENLKSALSEGSSMSVNSDLEKPKDKLSSKRDEFFGKCGKKGSFGFCSFASSYSSIWNFLSIV